MKKILLLVVCLFAAYTTSFSQDCTGPLTVTIQGSSSSAPLDASESAIVQPDCGPNGSIAIEVTGGTPAYTFQWQKDGVDYSTDQNLIDAGTGSYTVIITDVSGCSIDLGPFVLTEPDAIVLSAQITDPTCNMVGADFDGTIDLTASGGVAAIGFTYAWTTIDGSGLDAATEDQSGLGGGEYTVVVTDDNNCTATMSWTLTAPDQFDVAWTSENPDCNSVNGVANGSVSVNVTGGTLEYAYAWSTVDGSGLNPTEGNQGALGAGTYTLMVTDGNGCIIEKEMTLTEPTAVVVALSKVDPSCNAENGASNGSIDVTVSGGTGAYTYSWTSNGGTGLVADASNQTELGTGTYTVVVTDVNGCSETQEITLNGPDAIVVDATPVDPSCGDTQDGSITLNTVSGGDNIFTYNWNTINGSGVTTTDQSQADLGPGTYMLTITDGSGCSATFEWDLTAPEIIVVTIDNQEDPECHPSNGPENGTITVSATGGTGIYTYSWTSDNINAVLIPNLATQSNLPGGGYTVVVTDVSGCTAEQIIILTTAQDIVVSEQIIAPTCDGNNGSIWLAVSPGEGATYTYVWSTTDGSGIEQGVKDQTSLTPGTYTVVITNQNDCSKTLEYVVPNTLGLVFTAEVTEEILCNGDENGIIKVSASGGTGNLEYSIDGGTTWQNSKTFKDLAAGDYTIIVQDENGCQAEVGVTIDEPEALTAGTCTEAQDLCNANEGEIKVQAAGGVAPYTVTWTSPDGGTLAEISGTINVAGESFTFTQAQGGKSYSFVVTDANGCMIP